jgi:hypothetical protein
MRKARGIAAPVLSALIGLGLMAAPSLLDYGRPLATSDWIVGPLIASLALTSAWEVTRAVRWCNVPLAAWLALSPFVLGNAATGAHHLVAGILIGLLSLVPGRRRHSYAGGWRSLSARPCGSGRLHTP